MSPKRRQSMHAGEVLAYRTTARPAAAARTVELPEFGADVVATREEMRRELGDVPSAADAVALGRRSPEAMARVKAARARAVANGVALPNLRARRSAPASARETVHAGSYDRAMTTPNKRTVAPHLDGWAVKKDSASRASSVHDTQKQAIHAARQTLKNSGGGELAIKGRDGAVRAQDTVAPGNDPRSSKG